jgi:hypothetical protein
MVIKLCIYSNILLCLLMAWQIKHTHIYIGSRLVIYYIYIGSYLLYNKYIRKK